MKKVILITCLFFTVYTLYAQQDTRYDAHMNLPFNEKAGDVNPQTGNLCLPVTDLSLPGRGGMGFSFGRIWSLNQSNVFHMYMNNTDGSNELNSSTIEQYNHMGVGWSTTLPYVFEDSVSSGSLVVNLFFGGNVYQINRSSMGTYNENESNILYYDLKDLRFYDRTEVSYGDFTLYALDDLQNTGGIDDTAAEWNQYMLILKDNSKLYFREDGKLMMQQDKSGRNRIWYFYDVNDMLRLVVDTIGRKIYFEHDDATGNLTSIRWEVDVWKKNPDTGIPEKVTEERSISYRYETAEQFQEVMNLESRVNNYTEPFILTGVTDPMGNNTRYDYEPGEAVFTYDSSYSHSMNVYLHLTGITECYTEDGKYKAKRLFEYEVPAKEMYKKYFYLGYMEYYKISRQYFLNRHSNVMNDTRYVYHDNRDAGNRNQYSAVITLKNIRTTYTYSLSGEKSKNHLLDSICAETDDGFIQLTKFSYTPERRKALDMVYKQGDFVYQEKYTFDDKGNLTHFEDRQGLVADREYDLKFSIPVCEKKYVHAEGEQKEYVSESILDDYGQVIRQVVFLEQQDGSKRPVTVATITYDRYGNPTSQTDAHGNTVYMEYDTETQSFPIKIWQEVSIASWADGQDVHANWLTDPEGTEKVMIRSWKVFNSDGSPWLEVDNEGYAIEHYYDENGVEIRTVNPDENDITVSINTPDFFNFEQWPGFESFLDSRADNPGARIYINYQDEFVKTYADVSRNPVIKKITGVQNDGLGNTEQEIEYEFTGNEETGTKDADNQYGIKQMIYDELGRMVALTDPDAGAGYQMADVRGTEVRKYDKTWIVTYDNLGRKKQVIYPETEPGRSHLKRISYNDAENSITTVDPEGRRVYERMDWNGNLVEVRAYGYASTPPSEIQVYSYTYDELNRKTSFTDPKGIVTTYTYDERDLLTKQDYGVTGYDIMVYNDLGQLIKKTDRKGQVITFTYDEMGRNTAVLHYESEQAYTDYPENPVRKVATEYDNRGNAVRISNEHLIEHYVYNHSNMMILLERRLKDQGIRQDIAGIFGEDETDQIFAFHYTYNDAGMVTEMTYPDGSVHRFTYEEALARLSVIDERAEQDPGYNPFVTGFEYNKSGVVRRMDYANSTFQEWEFDNRKRIQRIRITGASGIIEDMHYTLNGAGDILSINENEYTYDGFDRIIGAKTLIPGNTDYVKQVAACFGTVQGGDPVNSATYNPDADLNPEGPDGRINGEDHFRAALLTMEDTYDVEAFEYDKNGNRTRLVQNGDEYRYTYGERNRLETIHRKKRGEDTESMFVEYEYDENGNTTRRTIYKEEGTQVIEFEYDTMNRLVKTIEGTEETVYYYDNAGNRFIKKGPEGDITLYLRHGQIAVAMDVEIRGQVSGSGVEETGKINRYVLSGDLLAGRITRTLYTDDSVSMDRSWYHLDHLNSTKCITDEDGVVEVNYVYRAFGEQLRKLGEGDAKYTYGGKELDGNTNLYYFNARYYDATIGRFINVDPIQDGSNWYVYCANNPLCWVDPTGLTEKKNNNIQQNKNQNKDRKDFKGADINYCDGWERLNKESGEWEPLNIGERITGDDIVRSTDDQPLELQRDDGRVIIEIHPDADGGVVKIEPGWLEYEPPSKNQLDPIIKKIDKITGNDESDSRPIGVRG